MYFGDEVYWISQSGGYYNARSGKIIAIVPEGEDANNYLPFNMKCAYGWFGSPRNYESYLILENKTKKVYWPANKNINNERVNLPWACPFCGGKAIARYFYDWAIFSKCKKECPVHEQYDIKRYKSLDDLLKAWLTRTYFIYRKVY